MISISAANELDLEKEARAFLERRGFVVTTFQPWETPGAICRRLEISHPTFVRRMRSAACPSCEMERDRNGRMKYVAVTAEAERFLISGRRA